MAALDRLSRAIFTVSPVTGGWAVEHEGVMTDQSGDKAEVIASASKRARASMDGGHPAQVKVEGEAGYF